MAQSRHFQRLSGDNTFYEIDFLSFLDPDSGPQIVRDIIQFYGCDSAGHNHTEIWQRVLERDNKTKSSKLVLDFDRDDLWSKRAESLYAELEFDAIEEGLGY